MGPKDPISNSPFAAPVRKVAALPTAHSIQLVKDHQSTKGVFGQEWRKRLKS